MMHADVIVLGGGAAGLMCAATAGRRGRCVLVLEGSNKVGKKILMSGGGRCNFTNLHCEPANFISANPHFCKSALSRYTQWDFIALVEKYGIPYHEKESGQLFCDNSSKDIVAMLLAECEQAGVEIRTSVGIEAVSYDSGYTTRTAQGNFTSTALVVATGGLSIPKMGATGFGYQVARQFGLDVLPTRAGLVPFTFSGAMHDLTERLSGVSTPAIVSTDAASFPGDILFTHRGLSGPATLQVSSYWRPGEAISIDLLPGENIAARLLRMKQEHPKSLLRTALGTLLPRALVAELQTLLWPRQAELPLADFANSLLESIGRQMAEWSLRPSGTEGYRTAEVTLGGVDTDALSSQTMEARNRPGLYFVGEVVDVTGHLGGFNFQWAWASGHAAGMVV